MHTIMFAAAMALADNTAEAMAPAYGIASTISIASVNPVRVDDRAGIDRRALVARHNARVSCDTLKDCSALDFQTLGNGEFAFTVDVTGLQTFNSTIPVAKPGPGDQKVLDCPVNTMSNWGW